MPSLAAGAHGDLIIQQDGETIWNKVNTKDLYLGAVNYTVCSATSNNNTCNYTTDGTADDVQIQAALDALGAVGGVVTLMDGTFTLTDAVDVPTKTTLHITSGATVTGQSTYAPSNCIAVGVGSVCSLIQTKDGGASNVNIIVDGDVNLENSTIDTSSFHWAGVNLHSASYSAVSGYGYIHHIGFGITAENTYRFFAVLAWDSDYNTIENVRVSHTGDDTIGIRGSADYNLVQNVKSSNAKFGHAFQIGCCNRLGGDAPVGNRIINNYGRDTVGTNFSESCIANHTGNKSVISGNHCEDTGAGIIVLGDSFDVLVEGNEIVNPNTHGIMLWSATIEGGDESTDNVIVSNNVIVGGASTGSDDYGVFINPRSNSSDMDHINVVGNFITGFGRGVYLRAKSSSIYNTSISNNIMRDNTTAGISLETEVDRVIKRIKISDNYVTGSTYGFLSSNFAGGAQDSISDVTIDGLRVFSTVASSVGVQIDGDKHNVTDGRFDVVGTAIVEGTGADNNVFVQNDTSGSGAAYSFAGSNSSWSYIGDTGNMTIDAGTGFGQYTADGSSGGCLMVRDTDDAGWSKGKLLDGSVTWATDTDGICD